MALVQLFHCTVRSSRVVFPDGTEGAFIDGRYATAEPEKIAYLDYEISKGHPNWYRDQNLLEIDEKLLDPMEALKAKIIKEAIESGIVKALETSEYVPPILTPASSADLVVTKTQEEAKVIELTGAAIVPTEPSPVDDNKLANLLANIK